MKTYLGSNEKIWYWLILLFSWSEVSVQEKIPSDYQELNKLSAVPVEQVIRNSESCLLSLTGDSNINNDQYDKTITPSNLHDPLLESKSGYHPGLQDGPADQLAYSINQKLVLDPRKARLLFQFAEASEVRNQNENTEVSNAPTVAELSSFAFLPRTVNHCGSSYIAFLIAGSVTYLYVHVYKRLFGEKSREEKNVDQVLLLLKDHDPLKIPEILITDNPSTKALMSIEVAQDIWLQLSKFEKKHKYLDKEINSIGLAATCNTNQRYLSHVINTYKKMSVPTYLKTLRIRYAQKRLTEDAQYLRYNMEGLADQFGFKTGRSFSTAFLDLTGKHVTEVIDELRTKKGSRDDDPDDPDDDDDDDT